MRSQFTKKLSHTTHYDHIEIDWCLENIGNADPEIRDSLVYMTFCHGLENQLFTLEQVSYLSNTLISKQLLASPEILTRSFATLLASLLVSIDYWEDSIYSRHLNNEKQQYFFQIAHTYLENETDFRGYDPLIGWIHPIAHGSELLLAASLHPAFPKQSLLSVWETILTVFKQQKTVFSAGESDRLAHVILQLILANKLDQGNLTTWISQLQLPDHQPNDYFYSLNIISFLSYLYLHLDKENRLSPGLKKAILYHIT